jgi:hypothetical protein
MIRAVAWCRKHWRTLAAVFAGFLLATVVTVGPYLAAARSTQTSQQVATLQRTEQGVASLLQFVASVQSGPQAKASRDATGWYLAEIRAICTATPGCKQVPLPPSLARLATP